MTAIPTIPLHDGVEIPQVGFGVFQVEPEETVAAVDAALRAGYRHIDTAALYHNEEQVGAALRGSGVAREDVFVTTKLWQSHHARDDARAAFATSRERLGVDVVDLYLIHWPAPANDRYVEAWSTLLELRDEGAIRAAGVSNFLPEHLQRVIDETGRTPPINQVELHPYFQQRELRAFHAEHGIVTESWSPLGRGGALLQDPVLQEIAGRHGRSVAQIVLRWHLEEGCVVIPRSVTPSRIAENLAITDFALTDEDRDAIAGLDRADGRIGPDPAQFG
jgi:diketogulonate reductase-like aldo/keto reductase